MPDKQYHHGNLKQELIEKGIQLLAEEGSQGFSMRKLAALCHVSHAAPYKHFDSKEAIIAEITQVIAAQFNAALYSAVRGYPDDRRMQIIESCVQYTRFMVEHPDYFRYIFMRPHGAPYDMTEDAIAAGRAGPLGGAAQLAEAYLRPFAGDKWRQEFLAMWSMVHGYTLMLVCETVCADGYQDAVRAMAQEYTRRTELCYTRIG